MKVLIIGGGVAGPALSLFLKKAGIESAVYEACPQERMAGGALSLAVNGMAVLRALGLADTVATAGAPVREWLFKSERGARLACRRIPVSHDGLTGTSLMRADLATALATEMRRQGLELHYGKVLTHLESGSDGVEAWFADGSTAKGDILVGADGIHSRTRKQIFPEAPEPSFVGLLGLGGRVRRAKLSGLDTGANTRVTFTFGAEMFFGICGVKDGDFVWWANPPSTVPMTAETLGGEAAILASLKLRCAGYHHPIPLLLENSDPPVVINIFDMPVMETWGRGRVILIGDAAHAVSPNSGQGASMALEDAMMLAMSLRDRIDYEDAFRSFQTARKTRCEKIVAFGRQAARDKEKVSPFRATVRNVFIALFFRLFSRRSMAWMTDYRIDWQMKVDARP